ncbi:hypothetical protein [Paenibacillus massiliensis]|uniref:hypothetical protein n=1 Tax=Paenibacillus massiliensis TaxID=225917 RepID=UPI00035E905B|nr:hypothetical protein [Paenibacillus massiliensis]
MNKYRITKYNPFFREANGNYLREDWMSISDIGKKFEGNILTVEEYKSVEDKYVKVIQLIMDYTNTPFIVVSDVRRSTDDSGFEKSINKYRELYNEEYLKDIYYNLIDTMKFSSQQIDSLVRLLLREEIGAEVYFETNLKVFIGYDFLMGIHTDRPIEVIIPKIEEIGLFVEKF